MVDADIFLLQMCATHLHPKFFLEIVLDRFKIKDWLSLSPDANHLPTRVYRDQEQRIQMIESALFFLVTILSNRQVLIIQIILDRKRIYEVKCVMSGGVCATKFSNFVR